MQKLLMATGNAHKVNELKAILKDYPFEIVSLKDIHDTEEPEETGYSFAENALIKARHFAHKYNIPVIADDSGISIEYFDHLPGVHSARFLDQYDYAEKNDLILKMMNGVKNRHAYYSCVIAWVDKDREKTYSGELHGEIALQSIGTNGFGYDPIFYVPSLQKNLAQADPEEKNAISHRGAALRKMVNDLEKV